MFDLLLFPMSFCIVLAFYKYIEWQTCVQREVLPDKNSDASANIVKLTVTNNNYDSLSDALDELNRGEAQIILGEPLHVNMRDYMQ